MANGKGKGELRFFAENSKVSFLLVYGIYIAQAGAALATRSGFSQDRFKRRYSGTTKNGRVDLGGLYPAAIAAGHGRMLRHLKKLIDYSKPSKDSVYCFRLFSASSGVSILRSSSGLTRKIG